MAVADDCLEDRAGVRWCVTRLQLELGRVRCRDGYGARVSAVHDARGSGVCGYSSGAGPSREARKVTQIVRRLAAAS